MEKKNKEYPKTFIDVLDFWHPDRHLEDDYQRGYKKDIIENFQDLLYARDAYWKIAGDEMGLGKPWKPDWTSFEGYPAIYMYRYQITLGVAKHEHHCFSFPTPEMRDAFYENFKKEIEKCKELL